MTISKVDIEVPDAVNVSTAEDTLTVELNDGRTISVPMAWYPRLLHATPEERTKWQLIGRGEGIRWDILDEDINIVGILAGRHSGESQASFKRWLTKRKKQP